MSEPGTIIIRPMVEADLEAALTIEQASFPAPWSREHFLHEIVAPHSFPFVALVDGDIAGYVCLMSLFEEAQILDVAVALEQRGKGIARLLMEHSFIVAIGEGAEFMALEVRESNKAAISLYERLGFVRTGTRRGYYEGKEDAVLMEKLLLGEN
jgi:[ribosomal protein S18]-alanine N-acetyltransferase